MEDCISREGVIKAIEGYRLPETPNETDYEEINRKGWNTALDCVLTSVKTIPPLPDVVPVVRGELIHRKVRHPLPWDCPPYYGDEYDSESHSCLEDEWHCSNCDYEADDIDKERWNFCPNCGMPMTEEALEILARRNGERKVDE